MGVRAHTAFTRRQLCVAAYTVFGEAGRGSLRDILSRFSIPVASRSVGLLQALCTGVSYDVNLGKISPTHVFVIEATRERWLHHHEIRRHIEVAGHVK